MADRGGGDGGMQGQAAAGDVRRWGLAEVDPRVSPCCIPREASHGVSEIRPCHATETKNSFVAIVRPKALVRTVLIRVSDPDLVAYSPRYGDCKTMMDYQIGATD